MVQTTFVNQDQGYQIEVRTEFDFTNSNPMNFNYLFKYFISITNRTGIASQLLSRKWHIKDGNGNVKIVEGPGVIGYTPQFKIGETFNYSSFSPLPTLTGEMWGHFNMMSHDGGSFKIETPHFYFKVPEDFIDRY
jgi:ApaG protein